MESRERGGRGRIAQVLKEARASLKEPSRPHTPASLDARTAMSLDGAMSRADRHDADRNGRGGPSLNRGGSRSRSSGNQQHADIWVNENYYSNDNSEVDTDGYASLGDSSAGNNQARGSGSARNSSEFVYGMIAEDLRQSIGNNGGGGSRRNSAEAESISQNVFGMTPSGSADELTGMKGSDLTSGKSNALQLMICDLRDSISALDNELGVSFRSSSGVTGASADVSLMTILSGMTQPVDRLAKHIKSGAKVAPGVQKDLDGLIQSVKRTLMRIVNDVHSNSNNNSLGCVSLPDTSRLACRHLLKVYLSLLAQVATSTLKADVARVIMRTTKALYLIDASPGPAAPSSRTSARAGSDEARDAELSGDTGDDTYSSYSHRQRGRSGSSSSSSSGGGGRGKGSGVGEEQMLQGGGDLLLELLQHTWTRLPSDLYREIQAQAGAVAPSRDRDGNGNGNGNGDKTGGLSGAGADDDGLPSHLDNPVFLLLEGAVYAAGIVRCYSSSPLNAKRLVHLGAVETAVTGMRVTASSIDVIDKAMRKKAKGGGEMSASSSSSSSSLDLVAMLTSQLARAAEQTTATLRAFTLEKQGRAKLLEQGAVALLCRLTAPSPPGPGHSGSGAYSPSPELVLNCVRATAKLSLLEPFRAQLNQKQANLHHVSALVAAEDDRAYAYEMGGGDGPWPQWHTWPLLSRVCFTLANLTTSNDANRHTIALTNDTMGPLLRLLGRCGVLLRRCAQERRRRKAGLLLLDQSASFDSDAGLGDSEDHDGAGVGSPFAAAEAEVEEDESGDHRHRHTGGHLAGAGSATHTDAGHDSTAARAVEQEVSDAAVKMLRLVANLAIEAKVGASVACDLTALNVVVALLADHVRGQQQGGGDEEDSHGAGSELSSEELLLNAVAASTNISYYACIQTDTYANMVLSSSEERAVLGAEEEDEYVLCRTNEEHLREFCKGAGLASLSAPDGQGEVDAGAVTIEKLPLVYLCRMSSHLASCLFHVNDEVVLEAARALGNLTRLPHVLRGMSSSRTDEALVLLLGHRSMEVVAAVAGTLVNLSAQAEARHNLLTHTCAVDSLTQALRRASMRHISTSMLVCQVFHNLFSATASPLVRQTEEWQDADSEQGQGQGQGQEADYEGLLDTLDELVDLAADVEEREDDRYAVFARIGGAVRGLLLERYFENDNQGTHQHPTPENGREEKGV